jgi:hypothetical protein
MRVRPSCHLSKDDACALTSHHAFTHEQARLAALAGPRRSLDAARVAIAQNTLELNNLLRPLKKNLKARKNAARSPRLLMMNAYMSSQQFNYSLFLINCCVSVTMQIMTRQL